MTSLEHYLVSIKKVYFVIFLKSKGKLTFKALEILKCVNLNQLLGLLTARMQREKNPIQEGI